MLRIVQNASDLKLTGQEHTVVTIGKFDGIHLGHQALIREAVAAAGDHRKDGETMLVVVFAINTSATGLLTDRERRHILGEMGVDILVECPLTPDFIRTEAETFIEETLVRDLHVRSVVTGKDFRFGYERRGDGALLSACGEKYGFSYRIVPDIYVDGEKVSSSRIRESVQTGDMELAEKLLGYPYFVTGEIIHGRQVGRTIGVPTANLITDRSKLLPPNGVYYTKSDVSGKQYFGITNIGTKPTVDGHFIGVETWFFDCDEDLYGEDLHVELMHFARPERKFGSLEELRDQIRKDEQEARKCLTR